MISVSYNHGDRPHSANPYLLCQHISGKPFRDEINSREWSYSSKECAGCRRACPVGCWFSKLHDMSYSICNQDPRSQEIIQCGRCLASNQCNWSNHCVWFEYIYIKKIKLYYVICKAHLLLCYLFIFLWKREVERQTKRSSPFVHSPNVPTTKPGAGRNQGPGTLFGSANLGSRAQILKLHPLLPAMPSRWRLQQKGHPKLTRIYELHLSTLKNYIETTV